MSGYEQSYVYDPALLQCSCSWETVDIHYPGLFTETWLSKAWLARQSGTNAAHLFFTHHLLLVKEQSSSLPWITKVPLHKLRQHINHCTVWIQNHAPWPTGYGWNMKRKLQVFTKLQNLKVLIFMNPVCTCDDVTIATCSHFRGLICPWVLQDSDKANKSACESENPQHTKLFSRDQIRSQVSSTSHNPSLSLLPSLPCSLLPLDKLMNPGASSAGRR